MDLDEAYYTRRECLRVPSPELFWAAAIIEKAVEAHIEGQGQYAAMLLGSTNTASIRAFVESLWGASGQNPEQVHYLRRRVASGLPLPLPRAKDRMPRVEEKRAIISRDGYRCRYCGVWVIPAEIRDYLHRRYPEAVPWGSKNIEQHSAFQALWLQYDHVLPACRGGDSSLDNIVVACAGCNYGKSNFHIDELGLSDPRERKPIPTRWDGLSHLLGRIAI